MKFGRKLKTDIYSEWKEYYLDYSKLKQLLKDGTLGTRWTPAREREFQQLLEQELEKIHNFQRAKTAELASRIREAETAVKKLVADYDDGEGNPHPDAPNHDLEAGDPDSEDESESEESEDAIEEKFRELEEEVATLVADVHDLALYTKMNFTGFIKIVKKHDKNTGLSLKNTFIQDFLDKRPFYKYNWDTIIVKLSRLYDLVRTRGHPVQGDSSAGGNQSAFVRQTTKYWVHQDNLVHLKLAILRHLPVLVFNPNKEFDIQDSAITSIYFDNEDLELYLGRLEKTEGAEAIRLRWYGGMDVKTVFVERKTHREDWTGEKSVKARFPIREENVNAFLRGEYTMDDEFEALVTKGKKTRAEVDSMIQLANEVQYSIITRKLVPVMRTFYNRTAFQLPGDARVRISLDTELTMVREDNWDGRGRSKWGLPGGNWRRKDIGIDYPFEQLPNEDVERFKYGVLEIKLQTQFGQEPPEWVRDLLSSHLVESVPKFSKFIHGCSTLLPNRVDLVPFWLPQMDTDIRKPDTGAMHIDRPTSVIHSAVTTDSYDTPDRLVSPGIPTYTEPVSEGEEDEDMAIAIARDEGKRTGLSEGDAKRAREFREQEAARRAAEEGKTGTALGDEEDGDDSRTPFLRRRGSQASQRPQNLAINPMTPSQAFDKTFKKKAKFAATESREAINEEGSGDEEHYRPVAPQEVELIRDFVAQPGKKIAVPVRVEPKVFFAQERTFLKWLQFSVLIGAIATTLLNFGGPEDQITFISAGAFTIASLLSIAYSTGIFIFRALKIRKREADGLYYDPYGPTALCVVLFAAVGINCGLRLRESL